MSSKGNIYYCMPYVKNKADYKKGGICLAVATYFRDKQNNLWVALLNKESIISFYSRHVFDRYYQRFENNEGRADEVYVNYALKFFCRNDRCLGMTIPNEKHGKNSILANIEDGV